MRPAAELSLRLAGFDRALIARLDELALTDEIVAAVLARLAAPGIGALEAIVALVCVLAEDRARLRDTAARALERVPAVIKLVRDDWEGK